MGKITPIPLRKFEKFLFFVGCVFVREKGDHRIYHRNGLKRPIVVPHDKEVAGFVIHSNLQTLGISTKEYVKIIEQI